MKITSPKAYSVAKYLLRHRKVSQLEISQNTQVAYSWTNEIINFLFERGIVSKDWRSCDLKDPFRLLEIIALERPLSKLVENSFRLEVLSISEGEKLLNQVCSANNVEYGLTAFSGLKKYYEYYISFPEIHAYVSDQNVEKLVPHGHGPITLNLLRPDHPTILKETKKVSQAPTCSPTQVVIDLFCSGAGRDAAIKLLEAIYNGKI